MIAESPEFIRGEYVKKHRYMSLYQDLKNSNDCGFSKNQLLYAVQESLLKPTAGTTANINDPIITGRNIALYADSIGKELDAVTYSDLSNLDTLKKLAGAKGGDVTFNQNGSITLKEQSPITVKQLSAENKLDIRTEGNTFVSGTADTKFNVDSPITAGDGKVVFMTGNGGGGGSGGTHSNSSSSGNRSRNDLIIPLPSTTPQISINESISNYAPLNTASGNTATNSAPNVSADNPATTTTNLPDDTARELDKFSYSLSNYRLSNTKSVIDVPAPVNIVSTDKFNTKMTLTRLPDNSLYLANDNGEYYKVALALSQSGALKDKNGYVYETAAKAWLNGMGFSEEEEQQIIKLALEIRDKQEPSNAVSIKKNLIALRQGDFFLRKWNVLINSEHTAFANVKEIEIIIAVDKRRIKPAAFPFR